MKALEWVEQATDDFTCREWDFRVTGHNGKWGLSPIDWPAFDMPFSSADEAKAAAQADFERRIRSALASPLPDPRVIPAGRPEEMTGAPAMRLETPSENIARDMIEGRFPERSEPKMRPDIASAWDAVAADGTLAGARAKLSADELRKIIAHAERFALAAADAVAQEPVGWRCFHCGQVFTDYLAAEAHFGKSAGIDPACLASFKKMKAHVLASLPSAADLPDASPVLQDAGMVERWRPIETAPKDGSLIWIAAPGAGPALARWEENKGRRLIASDPPYWEDFDNSLWDRQYLDGMDDNWFEPIYWRSIPTTPTALQSNTRGRALPEEA